MPIPGSIASQMPDDPTDLARRIAELERLVQQMLAAPTLGAATIDNAPGKGIRTSDFDGTSFADHGTAGNYFGGDGAVLNSLYLRPGSVSNAALTNPVVGQNARASGSNFGLTTNFAVLASTNLTVPAGCTGLVAVAGSSLYAVNPNTTGGGNTTGSDFLYSLVTIGSQSHTANPFGVSGGNGSATASSADAFTFSGLTPGSTLLLAVQGSTAFQSFPANTNNNCTAWAMLIWLR